MYLRTNRHTGKERFLNLEGLVKSFKNDGAVEKEIAKCNTILAKFGFVDKGHFWYRLSRPWDVVREEGVTLVLDNERFLSRRTARDAKELVYFGIVTVTGGG